MDINLSEKQEQAVSHKEGALLVKASAGSGKTRVLTERIKLLLDSTKRKVLAITFTNKAGAEMKERLGEDERITERVFIGTFHSFCQQVLEQRGSLIGLSKMPQIFENTNDRLELIEQAINQTPSFASPFSSLEDKKKRVFKYDVLEFISKTKRELWSENKILSHNDENTVLLCNTYNDILRSQNAIDFDDLIKLTYELLINNPSVASLYRRAYEYICIDEAQDLNKGQYYLLKAITNGSHNNVMMVGDENQSIYAFNGSSSDFMNKEFVKDFSPTIIELTENYRSSRKVIEAAEQIIEGSSEIVNMAITGVFEVYPANDEADEIRWINETIQNLISQKTNEEIEGEITYEKIAILVRNKYILGGLTKLLDEKEIPYYFKTTPGAIVFESKAMNVFDLALRFQLNPDDKLHWHRLLKLLNVKSVNTINELIENVEINYLKNILSLVISLNDDGRNLVKLLEEYSELILKSDEFELDDEKNMTFNDIKELKSHWVQYARKTDNKSLHQFKNAMALGKTHPNREEKGITLSTVHTMKGLEYDIVFLMGADEGTFPDYRAVKKGGVELIQEKNNTYVAFTRARRFLYVSYPTKRTMPWGDVKNREISRFLTRFIEE